MSGCCGESSAGVTGTRGVVADLIARERPIVVALAGQPNVGKTTVFNMMTGLNQHVGNWPGKTVERKEGTFEFNGSAYRLVDLPGTYSLGAASPDDIIIDAKSGTTGAGRSAKQNLLLSEAGEGLSPYSVASHRQAHAPAAAPPG